MSYMLSVGLLWWLDSELLPTFKKLLVFFLLSFEHSSKGWKLFFFCRREKKRELADELEVIYCQSQESEGLKSTEASVAGMEWDSCQLHVRVKCSQAVGRFPARLWAWIPGLGCRFPHCVPRPSGQFSPVEEIPKDHGMKQALDFSHMNELMLSAVPSPHVNAHEIRESWLHSPRDPGLLSGMLPRC